MSAAIDKITAGLVDENAESALQVVRKAYAGMETVAKYKERLERLKDIRRPMETKWRQVRDLLDPAASRWLGDDAGSADSEDTIDDSRIMDTQPRKMAQTAADGLHGGLSNSSAQWFSFFVGTYKDFDTEISKPAKIWLEMAQECVRDTLANTNFYVSLHSLYREMLEYGCALMMIYRDPDKIVRCYNYTIGSFWAAQNNRRIVDTVYIKSRQSAKDIAKEYGVDRCPEALVRALENKELEQMFTIIQCVQPWDFFGDALEGGSSFEFEDVRFLEEAEDDDPVLWRGGYRTKPFIFARWSESWDYVYPKTCPGIDALPDIRNLYNATVDYNLAIKWTSNPAFMYDSALAHDIKDIKPGMLVPVTSSNVRSPIQAIIPPVFDIQHNIQYRSGLINNISGVFYNREIMMISARAEQNHTMTATEVGLLQQEKNSVLGPIVNRAAGDILMPCLDRTFEIIQREWHILDAPPEELVNQEIKPYFTSDLAITQRQAWIQRANDVLMWLMQVGQIDPTVFDSVDLDQWFREYERTDVIPPFILKSRAEVEELRQQRAQQTQQQQRMQQLDEASKVGQRLGKTPTTGDNAAAELMTSAGGLEGIAGA